MTSPASAKRSYDVANLQYADFKNDDRDKSSSTLPVSPTQREQHSFSEVPHPPQDNTSALNKSANMPTAILPSAPEKPAKKAKLTACEKDAKKAEKEAKELQRIEEKARKDREKASKDAEKAAEKAAKDEERRKLKEAKDSQARLKEEEKQRKEDEKTKKARSQLRLNAFFHQNLTSDQSPNGSPSKSPTARNVSSPLRSRRSSVTEMNATEPDRRSRSVSIQATPSKPRLPDYQRYFPGFFLQSHTTLAPQNRFSQAAGGRSSVIERIDKSVLRSDNDTSGLDQSPLDLLHMLPKKRAKPQRILSLKEIVDSINGSSTNPIDLVDEIVRTGDLRKLLKDVPMKFLKFAGDVRPPYIGTYTKNPVRGSISSLARRLFGRIRPDTNYDYDSEAEWEDPIDGEDLDSEGDEDEEEEDEEEMEGFLDDEEPNVIKRRPLLRDQEPSCSGICWEGQSHSSTGNAKPDFRSYRIDILLENPSFPIDPFSTNYWTPSQPEKTSSLNPRQSSNHSNLMEPPRIPLSPINRTNALLKPPPKTTTTTNPAANKAPKPPKRFVDAEILDEFKKAIVGSDLTKMGLCEVLKKRFPKQKKDAIKDTLEVVAERVGEKVSEKKWVLRGGV